jgi:hypothetical protein
MHPAAHMNAVPADNTFIATAQDGAVYRIAGGAPIYVSTWDTYGGPQSVVVVDKWAVDNITHPAAHMNAVPRDGTFVNANQTGAVYRIAGGSAFYVSTWDLFGGVQPVVGIDRWAIDNPGHPAAHLRAIPADGTLLRGLPGGAAWRMVAGRRWAHSGEGAVDVDQSSLERIRRRLSVRGHVSVPQGGTAELVLTGTGLGSGDVARAGRPVSVIRSAVGGPTRLTAWLAVDGAAAPGHYDVTVAARDGAAATCSGCVTVTAAPKPGGGGAGAGSGGSTSGRPWLRVSRRGGRVILRWRRVQAAQRYAVVARAGKRVVRRRVERPRIRLVTRRRVLTVRITPVIDGKRGPMRRFRIVGTGVTPAG